MNLNRLVIFCSVVGMCLCVVLISNSQRDNHWTKEMVAHGCGGYDSETGDFYKREVK